MFQWGLGCGKGGLTGSEAAVHPVAEWEAHDDFLGLRQGRRLAHVVVAPCQGPLLLRSHLLRRLLLLLLLVFAFTLGWVLGMAWGTAVGTAVGACGSCGFDGHSGCS